MMPSNEPTKPLKVSLLTNMVAPYRVPLFRALAKDPGIEWLRILTCVEREVDRQWEVNNDSSYIVKQLAGVTLNLRRRGTDALRIIHLRFGIFWELLRHRPDRLIIGDASWTSYLSVMVCLFFGIPYVIWNEITTSSKVGGGVLTKVRRFMYRHARTCIASCQLAKDFLLNHGCEEQKIVTAHNAVDNSFFIQQRHELQSKRWDIREQLGITKEKFAFIYVGQLISRKRIIETIYAVAHTAQKNAVHLIICGTGPLENEIRNTADTLGFKNLTIVGNVNQKKLCEFYLASDALILLSEDEPWGMVINEALLFDLPVLTTNTVGATAIVNEKNGVVVNFSASVASDAVSMIMSKFAKKERSISHIPTADDMARNFLTAVRV